MESIPKIYLQLLFTREFCSEDIWYLSFDQNSFFYPKQRTVFPMFFGLSQHPYSGTLPPSQLKFYSQHPLPPKYILVFEMPGPLPPVKPKSSALQFHSSTVSFFTPQSQTPSHTSTFFPPITDHSSQDFIQSPHRFPFHSHRLPIPLILPSSFLIIFSFCYTGIFFGTERKSTIHSYRPNLQQKKSPTNTGPKTTRIYFKLIITTIV